MTPLRIGLELFGTQTASRHRGIGRYVRNLTAALLAKRPTAGHEFILYAEEGRPTDLPDTLPWKLVRPKPSLRDAMSRITLTNPDRLDFLIFLNPLELTPGFDIPARSRSSRGPRLAAVIYDLIPLLFQDDYLRRWPGSEYARRYLWSLERLRSYDLLFAISEATRLDTIRLLNIAPEKVVTIGAAGSDPAVAFSPSRDDHDDVARIDHLGITRPFVFAISATDPRKNLSGVLESFARLPDALRATHQLVVTVRLDPSEVDAVREQGQRLGLSEDTLILTGTVDDLTLRALYRRSEVFVFLSLYEGFGLPIVEAMGCGAAVVAGDNSSQPEAAGSAGQLVNPRDSAAVATCLERILTNHGLVRSMRERGPAQAARFTWEAVTDRTLEAIERHAAAVANPRARIALFGSANPALILKILGSRARIDHFHEPGVHLDSRFQARDIGCFDARLFDRLDRLLSYQAVVVSTREEADRLARDRPAVSDRIVFSSECVAKVTNRGL